MLGGDEIVLEALGFVLGLGEKFLQTGGDVDLILGGGGIRHFGKLVEFLIQARFERTHGHVGLVEDGGSEAALLFQEGGEQMLDIHLLIAVVHGLGLGVADGFLHFFGKFLDIHDGGLTNLSVLLSTNVSLSFPPWRVKSGSAGVGGVAGAVFAALEADVGLDFVG